MLRHIIFSIIAILFGALCAFLVLILLVRFLPVSSTLGIRNVLGLGKPQVIGFQPYWLVGKGKDTYKKELTTLTYFGLAVAADGSVRMYDKPGELEPGYALLQQQSYRDYLKQEKGHGLTLSLLVANMDEEEILSILSDPQTSAKTLVSSVSGVMKDVGFTDLNLDIESFTKATEATRSAYTTFVQTVKDELDAQKLGTLTVELTPKAPIEPHMIDVGAVGAIADQVVLMAYDYYTILSGVAGPIAPISGVPQAEEYDVTTALRQTLRFVPREKVILGIPTYGYEWETLSNTPGSAVIPGSWGTATNKRMEELIVSDATYSAVMNAVSQEPYMIFPGETDGHFQQIFYENKASLEKKLELAKVYNLGGVAFWAMGYEGPKMLDGVSGYKHSITNDLKK